MVDWSQKIEFMYRYTHTHTHKSYIPSILVVDYYILPREHILEILHEFCTLRSYIYIVEGV